MDKDKEEKIRFEEYLSLPKEQTFTYVHGHKVYPGRKADGELSYFFYDTGEVCNNDTEEVPPCPYCRKPFIMDESGLIDPCLGKLPGVLSACCGHGVTNGFISFKSGRVVRFDKDVEVEQTEYYVTKDGFKGANYHKIK